MIGPSAAEPGPVGRARATCSVADGSHSATSAASPASPSTVPKFPVTRLNGLATARSRYAARPSASGAGSLVIAAAICAGEQATVQTPIACSPPAKWWLVPAGPLASGAAPISTCGCASGGTLAIAALPAAVPST